MRDIGVLEKRIENIEYYELLNSLERATSDLQITDVNGLNRTKNGIIVDDFSNFSVGDVGNDDFEAGIDRAYGALVPSQNTVDHKLVTTGFSGSTASVGKVVTLGYTETPIIQQLASSLWVNVQPYLFAQFVGSIVMSPPADMWVETEKSPQVLMNTNEVNSDVVANTVTNAPTSGSNVYRRRSEFYATWFGSAENRLTSTSQAAATSPTSRSYQLNTTTASRTGLATRTFGR